MIRFFRGPLYEEAGTPSGGAAPVAPSAPAAPAEATAPAPAATEASDQRPGTGQPSPGILERIAATKAARQPAQAAPPAQGAPAPTEPAKAATPAAAEPAKPADPAAPQAKQLPKLEKPRETSMADRLKIKAAAEMERAKAEQQQTELARELERTREQLDLTTSASNKFRKAMDDGDFDTALKAIGVQGGVEGFTKSYLERKNAIPKEDPRLTEALKRLEEFEARERERSEMTARERAEQQQIQQYQADLKDLEGEAKRSGYPEIEKAAAVNGFTALAYRRIHASLPQIQSGDLTMDHIWSQTHEDYQKLFDDMFLSGAFRVPDHGGTREKPPDPAGVQQANSPDRSGVQSAQPRQPASHLSPATASEPVAQRVASGEEFTSDFDRRRAAARQRLL